MKNFIIVLSVISFMCSCQKEKYDESDLVGTWQLDWHRCDNYHVSSANTLSFAITDSTENVSTLEEYLNDSLHVRTFHFTFPDNETLIIDSIYDTDDSTSWLGSHKIFNFTSGSFQLERETPQCEREKFQFKK